VIDDLDVIAWIVSCPRPITDDASACEMRLMSFEERCEHREVSGPVQRRGQTD
jgi:hypothetical protein